MQVDWLIIGAGFSGAVLAERIATQLDKKVLIIEQRQHIAGNAYDYYDEHGILVHQYGPHIFHTNAKHVWQYLSQFTSWRPYYHQVLGVVDGKQVPIPFNLNSLYALFPTHYADKLAAQLLEHYGFNVKIPILKIKEQARSPELKFLADYIYEQVFYHYTLKQWGLTPEQLGPAVTARVPIYISRDDRYFQDTYQGLPSQGYTRLLQNLLQHKNIHILLNTDYRSVIDNIKYDKMVFTGPVDVFFEQIYGPLPYRSLNFIFKHQAQATVQRVGTVNYPNEYEFTRITEFKHLTGQNTTATTYVEEYPLPHVHGDTIPYYPIPTEENKELYRLYQAEAEELRDKVIFAGRLADYQYYNMDQAVARALSIFAKQIINKD
jgi:UDP-galactopyranose mutase